MSEETITITKKEYERLQWDSRALQSLEKYGVDNWDGYSEALRELWDEDDDLD